MLRTIGIATLACVCTSAANADPRDYYTSPIVWVGTLNTADGNAAQKTKCHSEIREQMPGLYLMQRSVCDDGNYTDGYYASVWQQLIITKPPAPGAHIENNKIVFEDK